MEFNKLFYKFFIRIIVLSMALFALIYCAFIWQNIIRSFFAFVFILISITEFLHFVNKTNKDLKSFVNALIYEDFSNFYSKSKTQTSELYGLFNKLNNKYRKIAFEKEVQHAFLQTIIEHISIGILVVDFKKNVLLVNNTLLKLIRSNSIQHLDEIKMKSEKLSEELEKIEINKPRLLELSLNGELYRLSINASDFKLNGVLYRLISIQNINYELDEQEIIAWQKLIRVLTHEIMNSVTPISSLTSSLNNLLSKDINSKGLEPKHMEYLLNGLKAVQERSEGLLKFTESYKKLTQIKHPDFEKINMEGLFKSVLALQKASLDQYKIKTSISESQIDLLADKSMLEQVLINLITNSIDALKETSEPYLQLNCFKENNRVVIQVIDNGKGIPEDKIDKIFIPFFTTKEKGSGIGLSFARQVMRLHKGNIFVKSINNKTIFTLKF